MRVTHPEGGSFWYVRRLETTRRHLSKKLNTGRHPKN
nr:MAG TPA: hypothetical protein [Caudoviricetes sp.]DAS42280.1 MAG TPA: hypothetical protein [Caudoviricetes sp.]